WGGAPEGVPNVVTPPVTAPYNAGDAISASAGSPSTTAPLPPPPLALLHGVVAVDPAPWPSCLLLPVTASRTARRNPTATEVPAPGGNASPLLAIIVGPAHTPPPGPADAGVSPFASSVLRLSRWNLGGPETTVGFAVP
ncbi:hypothetical protein Vafri_9385, partial [Volvox africanus]